jgi:hypothetical protein
VNRHLLAIALLIGLWLLSAGCGYRLVQYQAAGGSAPSICIITLTNDSALPGLELMVSESIRKTVTNRGGLRLISDPASADYVMRGRILPVEIRGRTFTGVVLALEYSAELSLEVSVRGREGRNLSLSSQDLTATDLYLASADLEAGRKNRDEALRRLSQLLAMRIHDVMDRELLMEASP